VLALAVGGYFAFKSDKPVDTDTVNISNTVTPEVKSESGKKMAFAEFVKNPNGSYKCEVKQSMSDMENTGTVYISSGKIKGDYTTIAEGKTMKTSFIMKDGYSYTWGDMMAGMGFKVKVVQEVGAKTDASASGTYSWNAEQIGDYDCQPWVANDAMFALPSGVTFKEM
jgi:hypothetical protein